jgi:indole-3-pyruvate monooxygenase
VAPEHTVIIGAGPAGLAAAACLKRAGVEPLVLERADRVGAAWRAHYDRLHLHTPKSGSALPFLPYPDDYPRYPSRQQVIDYLEAYAARFGIAPRFGEEVMEVKQVRTGADGPASPEPGSPSGRAEAGAWQVRTKDAEYCAENLVIAAGYNRQPNIPSWPGQDHFAGEVLHSSQYRNGEAFRDRDLLVVGFGNSGGEIAVDLCEHGSRVAMAVRGPVNIVPREILGIPAQRLSIAQRRLPPRVVDTLNGAILRFIRPDLSAYGLRWSERGPATQIAEQARIPLIDIGTVDLIRHSRVVVHPGIERFTRDGVVFTSGAQARFDAVILATGYRPRVDALLRDTAGVLDAAGTPLVSGYETPRPGLFFCGYKVTATGALREIGLEAQRIARAITGGR